MFDDAFQKGVDENGDPQVNINKWVRLLIDAVQVAAK